MKFRFRGVWCFLPFILLTGCGPKKAAVTPPAPEVTVVHPIQRELVEWDEYTGRLQAPESVEVRPRVGGYLQSINFNDGQLIKQGDLLFVIDPRPFQAALDGAVASLNQALSGEKLATANYNRALDLQKKKVIAAEEFDTSVNSLKAAQASVASAQAALTNANLNVSYTQVTAPVSGRISRHQVSVGNLITANTTLLTTIVSLDPIYCYFQVDEQSYLKYTTLVGKSDLGTSSDNAKVGIEMELSNETGFPHHGRLNFVDNQIETQTATIELRAVFENSSFQLTPGLFNRVRIPARPKATTILIPDEAVGSDQTAQYVYVVGADNKAQRQPIETGPLSDDGLRIVRKGITTADRIIALGLIKVQASSPVKPIEKTIEQLSQPPTTPAAPATSPAAK